MFHEKLSSSYRRWPFGWRTAAWLAHYRLAGALPLGRRAAAWLAHCCLVGALLLGRRIAAWLAHCCLDRRTVAGTGARRGRLAAAVRTMRRRRRPCFWLFCGASSCSKRSRV